MQFTYMYIKCV